MPRNPTVQTKKLEGNRRTLTVSHYQAAALKWLPFAVWTIALAAALSLVYIGKSLLAPIVVALLLRILLGPLSKRLAKIGIPATVSAVLLTMTLAAGLGGVFYLVSDSASDWIREAPERVESVKEKMQSWVQPIESMGEALQATTSKKTVAVREEGSSYGLLRRVFSETWEVTYSILATLVMLFFLLARGDSLARKLPILLKSKDIDAAHALYQRVEDKISRYMLAISAINVAFGVCVGITMHLLDVPNPLLWGAIAAALNFLPYVGALVGAALMTFVSIFAFEAPVDILMPPAAYLLLNGIEAYLVTPTILGHSLSLSPVAVIVSLMVWGWLWGVVGVVISVPLLIAVKVAASQLDRGRVVDVLLRE